MTLFLEYLALALVVLAGILAGVIAPGAGPDAQMTLIGLGALSCVLAFACLCAVTVIGGRR